MPELRFDPLRGDWVAYASDRNDRTFLPTDFCPLCPSGTGGESEVPVDDFEVVVLENRFPAFGPDRRDGRPVRLDLLRGPAALSVRVSVSEQRDSLDRIMTSLDAERNLVRKIGVLGVAIDSTVAAFMPGLRIRAGVLVVAQALDAGGTPTGLEAGDVIHTTNRTPIGTLEDLRAALRALKSGDAVVLGIERAGGLLFLPFELN